MRATQLIASAILGLLADLNPASFLEGRYSIELETNDLDASNLRRRKNIDRLVPSKLAAKATCAR